MRERLCSTASPAFQQLQLAIQLSGSLVQVLLCALDCGCILWPAFTQSRFEQTDELATRFALGFSCAQDGSQLLHEIYLQIKVRPSVD